MKRGRYRYRPRLPADVRFWLRVEVAGEDECWPWVGARDRDGYGLFMLNADSMSNGRRVCMHAQRFAWMLVNGPVPGGLHVLHHCDNPCCVNHAHLFLGTNADNVADRDRKGRTAKGDHHAWRTKPECMRPGQPPRMYGEANPSAKLTDAAVRTIRADSRTARIIAKEYGVSKSLINAVRRGEIWRDVGNHGAARMSAEISA
jgi:hypothetical protein